MTTHPEPLQVKKNSSSKQLIYLWSMQAIHWILSLFILSVASLLTTSWMMLCNCLVTIPLRHFFNLCLAPGSASYLSPHPLFFPSYWEELLYVTVHLCETWRWEFLAQKPSLLHTWRLMPLLHTLCVDCILLCFHHDCRCKAELTSW